MINIQFPSPDDWFWSKNFYPEGIDLFKNSDILVFNLTHRKLVNFLDFVNFNPILAASQRGFNVVKHVI
jgi:hypothetical protein